MKIFLFYKVCICINVVELYSWFTLQSPFLRKNSKVSDFFFFGSYCNNNSLPLYMAVFIFYVATSFFKKCLVVYMHLILWILVCTIEVSGFWNGHSYLSVRWQSIHSWNAELLLIFKSHLRAVLSFTSHNLTCFLACLLCFLEANCFHPTIHSKYWT